MQNPTGVLSKRLRTCLTLSSTRSRPSRIASSRALIQPLRSLSTTQPCTFPPASRSSGSSSASSSNTRPTRPAPRGRIDPADAKGSTNASIPFRQVQLASSGGLSALQPLRAILSEIDTSTHTLICVSVDPPVVRILDNAAEREKARHAEARLKLTRKAAAEDKEVQVSWGSAVGDLKHKAALARGILERGDRATIIFAAKSGGAGISYTGTGEEGAAPAKREQKERVIAVFEEALEDIGMKWTDDEVRKGALVQRWQPEKKVRAEIRQKVQNEEVEKKRDKEEKKEARRKKEEERKRKAEEKQREAREALLVEENAATPA